jgi:hypothetical protein
MASTAEAIAKLVRTITTRTNERLAAVTFYSSLVYHPSGLGLLSRVRDRSTCHGCFSPVWSELPPKEEEEEEEEEENPSR